MAGVALLHVDKTGGRHGKKHKRCFWRSFFVADAVFGELERHSERVEKIEFCEAVFICDFGIDIP